MGDLLSLAVLGVDPGKEGGLALIGEDGQPAHGAAIHGEMTEQELVKLVISFVVMLRGYQSDICYFEKVGFIKGDGGKGAFTFGRVNGVLAGALLAQGIKPHYVPPMIWQSRLQCLTGGNKNVSKRRAQALFPNSPYRMTHNLADATLIGRYGWEMSGL